VARPSLPRTSRLATPRIDREDAAVKHHLRLLSGHVRVKADGYLKLSRPACRNCEVDRHFFDFARRKIHGQFFRDYTAA
jgi:hypothetical protein